MAAVETYINGPHAVESFFVRDFLKNFLTRHGKLVR